MIAEQIFIIILVLTVLHTAIERIAKRSLSYSNVNYTYTQSISFLVGYTIVYIIMSHISHAVIISIMIMISYAIYIVIKMRNNQQIQNDIEMFMFGMIAGLGIEIVG
ncbi:hypothetical protein D1T48_gp36 [Thermoproteus tenax virus 1]|uniref:Uncharacterized 12.1 kDa protein n=1 Tax=Thermoproteus tenax virus 1 (strain KRA1) TaxID=10480 RepID=YORW_TTV1K|nr:hypothetical protein D1T48_gp36 [Thermoproteus tenax virus 1]P19307.1 RecName: Full=Uncharacterized 12.1 kDa protein [Thermoproteus tenax virus 1 (STRAIN KRA1)]CAA32841.1 unnamed protein product [Thermoproteus tenax virus 1]CAA33004.1 unnamed protein product [Thermoproteus tenax virus 1]